MVGLRELDKEIFPLIDDYFEKHGVVPKEIVVSKYKMRLLKLLLPEQNYNSMIMFRTWQGTDIPVNVSENQTEDYRLVAE